MSSKLGGISIPYNRRRKDFEVVLMRLIDQDTGFFVQHVAKAGGWDLVVAAGNHEFPIFIPIEVKTSKFERIDLTKPNRVYEQMKWYKDISQKHKMPVFYAYRLITRKKRYGERDKWKFFRLNKERISMTWRKGMTYHEFLKYVKSASRRTEDG